MRRLGDKAKTKKKANRRGRREKNAENTEIAFKIESKPQRAQRRHKDKYFLLVKNKNEPYYPNISL
jgi:hypothetical protein